MGIGLGYTDPTTVSDGEGEFVILPPREHAAELTSIKIVKQRPHPKSIDAQKGITEIEQLKWTFKGIKYSDPQSGKPGVISQWTGFNYGNPKAKMTPLLNCIFGRSLTSEEAQRLDIEKLVGSVRGWVSVWKFSLAGWATTALPVSVFQRRFIGPRLLLRSGYRLRFVGGRRLR